MPHARVIPPVDIDEAIDFSRASEARYYDSTGALAIATTDELRITYDPWDLDATPHLLIEPAGTNRVLYSADLTQSNWTKQTGASVLPHHEDPSLSLIVFGPTLANGQGIYQYVTVQNDSAATTVSAFIRPGTLRKMRLLLFFNGGTSLGYYANVDLDSDDLVTFSGGDGVTGGIEEHPNGWYRVWVTGANNASGNTSAALMLLKATTGEDGTFTARYMQHEAGERATSYIPTTTTAVTRAADDFGDGDGLLYSSISEPDTGEISYGGLVIYETGDVVIDATSHRKYESLHGKINEVTITIASPGVIAWQNHGLAAGTRVKLSTTGALPTGLTEYVDYYVVNATNDTFRLAATEGGTAINTSGSQSGTHTAYADPNVAYDLPVYPELVNDHWQDIGATNRWEMFERRRAPGTVSASPLIVAFRPGVRIDAIGFAGLEADALRVGIIMDGEEVFTETIELRSRTVLGWYDWLTKPFEMRPTAGLFELPTATSAIITLAFSRAAGDVTVGSVVFGRAVNLGETVIEPESDERNFSQAARAFDGTATIVKRRSIPVTNQRTISPAQAVNALRSARRDLNAEVAFWAWTDDIDSPYFDAGSILGFYTRWMIVMDSPAPEYATNNLEVEEV